MATASLSGTHEDLYRMGAGEPVLVEVPVARFLVLDGVGSPGGDDFQRGIRALFTIGYTAKSLLARDGGPTVKLPPLEGLYSTGSEPGGLGAERERLAWTLLLRLPEPFDDDLVSSARTKAQGKGWQAAIEHVRTDEFDEGTCAQLLHVGPYSKEAATVARLDSFIDALGLEHRGRHHEIYLGDPRRGTPERLKTILRHPCGP